ncbi:MAG: amino acid adenylation domain-containing protein [Sediminibacterium sp.]|nr:amino acid adenylation domain-containing protein [Sediminibacterium sp.]
MKALQTINAFLNELRIQSGAIWTENGKIKFSAPKSFQNKETDAFIVTNKQELISLLEYNQIYSSKLFLTTPILKSTSSSVYPLSPAQKRLWFIEQYEEGTNAYHLPMVMEISETARLDAIKYAIQQIVIRHEILRSTINEGENQDGIQVVHSAPLEIEEVTLDDTSDYESVIRSDINQPFNLSKEYPLRVKFYKLISSVSGTTLKNLLLMNTHHIASDGWSLDIMQRELEAFYSAFVTNQPVEGLTPMNIQYKDYALWQDYYITGEVLEQQLQYWKNKLSNYQHLEFPTDYQRPSNFDYRGHLERFSLPVDISMKLRAIAKQNEATLFSVMLSSIAILLSKYSGQDDIIIGSPIANRHHNQVKNLIGFFVNTQVNRVLTKEGQTFRELIQEVHQDQIEAQQHQDLPFDKLVDELKIERNATRHPLCQIMLSVQSFGYAPSTDTEAHKSEPLFKAYKLNEAYEVERFDLSILVDDSEDRLAVELSYSTSLFKKSTIEALFRQYNNLLDQLTSEEETPYYSISLLDEENRKKVLYDWNETNADFSFNELFIKKFEKHVQINPLQTAISCEGKYLTYQQLDEKSNQLAQHILNLYQERTQFAMEPGSPILLFLNRSPEAIIAMLAVLKAGGAFVPVDTSYPQERIDFMLKDTEADFIISTKALSEEGLVKLPKYRVINIDLSVDLPEASLTRNLPDNTQLSHPAYIIYTSGTTGKPKGVVVTQNNLLNLCYNIQHHFELAPDSLASQLITISFDGAVSEIFPVLFSGGALHIIPEEVKQSADLSAYINAEGITHFTVPADLLESMEPLSMEQLKTIHVGGGTNSRQCLNRWSRGRKLINAYGPTENTVYSTMHSYNEGDLNTNIGSPIKNVKVYVLDKLVNPVPVGVPGELYISGKSTTNGYLNRRELTRERFIQNPFVTSEEKQSGYGTMYKTGDKVRWLENGELEFLGRNDDQVKIRGYRIELSEIEQALLQLEEIKQAHVQAREKVTENGSIKYLIAYYIVNDSSQNSGSLIQQKLQNVLPAYMVPSYFIEMDKFPLTTNGKLNKSEFPDPSSIVAEEEYKAPSTKQEEAICLIWQEIIGQKRVGVSDDFFKIGGNSILAIQVAFKMSKLLGYTVKVADIFRLKTISELLNQHNGFKLITQYQSTYSDKLPNFIFIHAGGSGSEVYQQLSEKLAGNYNCIGIDNYNIHYENKIASLNELASYYLQNLEKSYVLTEPVNLLGWSLGGKISIEIAAILESRGYKAINVFALDTIHTDDYLRSFITREYVEQARNQALESAEFKRNAADEAYYRKVFAAIEAETEIGRSDVSSHLEYTQVYLFKAMNVDMFKVLEDAETKNNYLKQLNANNLNMLAEKVQVIPLDCYHDDILDVGSNSISDFVNALSVQHEENEKMSFSEVV